MRKPDGCESLYPSSVVTKVTGVSYRQLDFSISSRMSLARRLLLLRAQVNYAENHPLKKLLEKVQELIVEMAEGEDDVQVTSAKKWRNKLSKSTGVSKRRNIN